jgi:hypothetical protein
MHPAWAIMELIGVVVQLNMFYVIPLLSGLGLLVFLFHKFYLDFLVSRFPFYTTYTRFTYALFVVGCIGLVWVASQLL